jgi:hypothetical protein
MLLELIVDWDSAKNCMKIDKSLRGKKKIEQQTSVKLRSCVDRLQQVAAVAYRTENITESDSQEKAHRWHWGNDARLELFTVLLLIDIGL